MLLDDVRRQQLVAVALIFGFGVHRNFITGHERTLLRKGVRGFVTVGKQEQRFALYYRRRIKKDHRFSNGGFRV